MQATFALFALSVLVAGCAATPSRYDTMLGELRRDDDARADHGEAAVTALVRAPVLDRRALVEAAIAANRDVEAMRQGWRASVLQVPAAGALDDPMLQYEVAPLSIGSSVVRYGNGFSLRQKLPFPGKRGLEADTAAFEAEAREGDYHALQQVIAARASQLYDDAYFNVRAIEVNEQHRLLVEKMKQVAEARMASGRGSTQDALQAEVELGHLVHERVVLDSMGRSIRAQLNGLLHRDPSAPLPSPPADLPIPPDPPPLAELERAAVEARPQKVAAEARARARQADVDLAKRAYYPDFELMGSYSSMWPQTQHRWMLGIGIELPLQRGKRDADVDAATARVTQARAEVERVVDDIRVDVTRSYNDVVEAIHVAKLYDQRLLPAARAAVDAALAGFMTGVNDFPAVILAERELRETELGAYRAHADASRQRATLDRAIGRLAGGAVDITRKERRR